MPDEKKTGESPMASTKEREQPTPPSSGAPVPPLAQPLPAAGASKPAPPTAGAAAKPPVVPPAKPAAPQPIPWQCEMVTRFRARFGSGIREANTYVGQNYLVVDPTIAFEALQILHDDQQFDYCVDVTAVHYPKRVGQEFDIVWILYSFARNERVRVKTSVADGATVMSAVSIWAGANWLERECYDMFGIRFEGHPDMKRILLPEDWKGYPLRKEYDIQQQDKEWIQTNVGTESGQ